jgi:hypothetical protein
MIPEQEDGSIDRDQDPGPPISILRDQEHESSSDFMQRIRRRIYRRTAASQIASYSWHLPKIVLFEMTEVLAHLLKAFGSKKEPRL